jgi:hypothetical protein
MMKKPAITLREKTVQKELMERDDLKYYCVFTDCP